MPSSLGMLQECSRIYNCCVYVVYCATTADHIDASTHQMTSIGNSPPFPLSAWLMVR